ncbi:MAG: DNA topoisomerase IV subunit A [Erysipelotrichaceae bacterium]
MKQQNVITTPLEEIMGERFGRYSKYIIQDRALPDVRDGLKPVQRRILYAMYEDGNTSERGYRKSVKTVGLVIGNYHPHGDSSVYDAMVRMSQYWKMREMLIDMHGNNGSIDDDPAAAMRYTEARLAPISETLLRDIDKNTVHFAPNFDDTSSEPTVLPAAYPNLLVNGITGIAAGYATNIPPHNLGEVIDGTIHRMKNPNCGLDALMQHILGPDFPTGGTIQGVDGIKDAFEKGKGRVVVRSKLKIVQNKTNQQIVIHEIPYEVIKSNLVKKIDEIRINKTIDGLLDVRDESDRNGLNIVIDVKKDVDANLIVQYLYKNTDLQVYYNYNMVSIVHKRPLQLGILEMIDAYIEHRKEVVYKRSRYDYDKKAKRAHLVEGLIKAISVLDEVIAIIRNAQDKADAKAKIIARFDFSEEQAEAIVVLRLYRLSNTDVTALQGEYATLTAEMKDLLDIMEQPALLNKTIISELKEIKKRYATPRKSDIQANIEELVINKQAMIANEKVMLTMSKAGYIKRVSLRSFGASDIQTKIKDGDELLGYGEINTVDKVLFFTKLGQYGYLDVHEIEEAKWKDIGSHLNAYVKMENTDSIVATYAMDNFASEAYIISLSKQGMIKKTALADFEVSRNNKLFNGMNLAKDDEVVQTLVAYPGSEVCLLSEKGYVTRYNISLIPLTSAKAKGVKAMNLVEDQMVDACIIKEQDQVVFLNSQGGSKRMKANEIGKTGRPARGEMICKKNKTNPYRLRYVIAKGLNESFFLQNGDNQAIDMKDITIMSKDATFSSALHNDNFYLYQHLQRIAFVEKTSETEEVKEQNFEMLNLDL